MSELAVVAFAAATGSHLLDEPRSVRFARFRRAFDEASFLRDLAARGFRWVSRSDPAFPAACARFTIRRLGCSSAAPPRSSSCDRPCIAIVGARACSPYGTAVALTFGRELAAAGAVVISGLARGVDGAAHRGALDAGTTVAVLGCGIDRDYPRAHATLAAAIAQRGLIVRSTRRVSSRPRGDFLRATGSWPGLPMPPSLSKRVSEAVR